MAIFLLDIHGEKLKNKQGGVCMQKVSKKLFWVLLGLMLTLVLGACTGQEETNSDVTTEGNNASEA